MNSPPFLTLPPSWRRIHRLRSALLLLPLSVCTTFAAPNDVTLRQMIADLPQDKPYHVLCTQLVDSSFSRVSLPSPTAENLLTPESLAIFLRSHGIPSHERDGVLIVQDPELFKLSDNALEYQASGVDCSGPTQSIIACMTNTYRVAIRCIRGPAEEKLIVRRQTETKLVDAFAELSRRNKLDAMVTLIPANHRAESSSVTPPGVKLLEAKFNTVDLTLFR